MKLINHRKAEITIILSNGDAKIFKFDEVSMEVCEGQFIIWPNPNELEIFPCSSVKSIKVKLGK